MSFKVKATVGFAKQLKRLSKKYPSLREDYAALVISLKQFPTQGKPLGGGCYKVRLAIASKNKGKSSGARIITFLSLSNKVLFLVALYDKAEHNNISDKALRQLLAEVSVKKLS